MRHARGGRCALSGAVFFGPDHEFPNPYAGLPGTGPDLVFTGNMDYRPNADAVCWFVAEVMPRLWQLRPAARLHIVGANPGPAVKALAGSSGIYVTGRVADVRPYLAHAAVAVAPLAIARGIQNKVLEAMAMGKPTVVSPGASEGIRAKPGRDFLVANGSEAMARCISDVLEGRYSDMGRSARALVEVDYSPRAALARLDQFLAMPASATPR